MNSSFLKPFVPYLTLLFTVDLLVLIRKIIFLYGTARAFIAGILLFGLILAVSVMTYLGKSSWRKIYLVMADIYCGAALPLSSVQIIQEGFSLPPALRILFSLIILSTIITLTGDSGTEGKRMAKKKHSPQS